MNKLKCYHRRRNSVLLLLMLIIGCMSACGKSSESTHELMDLDSFIQKEKLHLVSDDRAEMEKQDADSLLTDVGIDPLLCNHAVYYASDEYVEKLFLAEMTSGVNVEKAAELLEQYAKDYFSGCVKVFSNSEKHLLCLVVSSYNDQGEIYENRVTRSWIYLGQIFIGSVTEGMNNAQSYVSEDEDERADEVEWADEDEWAYENAQEVCEETGQPGPYDLEMFWEEIGFPSEGNWLSEYETKYVKTESGDRAYLRRNPSAKSKHYDFVYEGDEVTVLARQGKFSLVWTQDGLYGWVTSSVLVDQY